MIWNPSENVVSNVGTPLMGGVHPIYIFSHNQKSTNGFSAGYDFPAYLPADAENNATNALYQKWLEVTATSTGNTLAKRELYGSLTWVAYPTLKEGFDNLATDVSINLRINKEYKDFVGSGENGGKPMYSWSMEGMSTVTNSNDKLSEALEMINVVPNPYRGYSEYERNKLDNRIKITNLPEVCTVKIYTVNGKLVRTFKKDSPVTFLDWTLTNHQNIPVSSGVYLIHIDIPGVGERVLKAFIAMRMIDLQNI